MTKRFGHIDFLRAVSILGVICIHTYWYFLTTPLNSFIWNYLQFVVVGFIFCSGYVLSSRYQQMSFTFPPLVRFYKNRFLRLLLPFYFYLCFYYLLWIFFPNLIHGIYLKKDVNFLEKSFLLVGGIDSSWLPLLFLQLSLVFPLLMFVFKKNLWGIWTVVTLGVSIFFSIHPFPYDMYKLVMVIPWSFIFGLGAWISHLDQTNSKKTYWTFSLSSGVCFFLFYLVLSSWKRSLYLIDHKYPPDIFHLSYGLFFSFLLLSVYQLVLKSFTFVTKVSFQISSVSYQLFFVHYIILDILIGGKHLVSIGPLFESLLTIVISFSLAKLLTILQQKLTLLRMRNTLSSKKKLLL